MPGGDGRQRCLILVTDRDERVHDAPDRAEQADVWAGRADRGQQRDALLEILNLAHLGHAHLPLHGGNDVVVVGVTAGLLARVFLIAGDKDRRESTIVGCTALLLVQVGQIATAPEAILELFGLEIRRLELLALLENHRPREDRGSDQREKNQLRQQARLQDQMGEGHVCVHGLG